MPTLFRRLTHLFRANRIERDLTQELEHHRELRQQQLERSGMSPSDAEVASRRALGNVTLAIEDAREVWIWPSLERLWQDVRFGLRMLRRQPAFAATAILILAIGMGATTSVFSVVEFEIWKPLPFPNPDRLVEVYTTGKDLRGQYDGASGPELVDWRAQSRAFEQLAGYGTRGRRVLRAGNVPESVSVMPVTSNYFATLGRDPALGRAFNREDDRSSSRVVLLSDACWRRHFSTDSRIVGRNITIDDQPFTVIGVMSPAPYDFMVSPDLFVVVDPQSLHDRTSRDLGVIGRMRDGVSLESARADLQLLAQRLAQQYPVAYEGRGIRIDGLRESNTGWNWRPLFFFLGAALFVLLLTCVNVAGLLLARALGRDREFAIRRALGGGRAALVRQLIVEGSLLTLPAAALGLLAAKWAIDLLPSWLPPDYLSRGSHIELDVRVYLFALIVSGLTTILFGLAPAMLTSRRDLSGVLAQGGRTIAASPGQRRARHALVVAEVTMTVVLVVGAGLFVNSFVRLTRVPLGFDPHNRLAMRVSALGPRYADRRQVVPLARSLVERARAVPGVTAAVAGSSVPLGSGPNVRFVVTDRPRPDAGEEPQALIRAITPGYFRVLGIALTKGRDFNEGDSEGGAKVAVINENLARRIFPGKNPLGHELVLMESSTSWVRRGTVQIVAIAANMKEVGIHEVDFNSIFVPLAQSPPSTFHVITTTAVPPANVVDLLRAQVLAVDADLPVSNVTTMSQLVEDDLCSARFNLLLIGVFAVLGIVMAAVGIYGTMSYTVQQRTQEFGVRLALGAPRSSILGLALGQAARLGVIGTAVGLGISLALARIIGNALYLVPRVHNGLIYGVSTTDPLTLTCACALLMIVAALAGLLPARRATRVDPVVALRTD
jgi:predicted permease